MLNRFQTRMHSSGMHTARFLTISQHALHRVGLPGGCLPLVQEGVSASGPGGSASGPGGGVCLPLVSEWGGEGLCISACNGADTPLPVDRQAPVKTQPSQTSFAGGKNALVSIVKQTFYLPTVQLAGFISSSFLPIKYHTQANQWARTVNMAISSVSTTKLKNKTTMA